MKKTILFFAAIAFCFAVNAQDINIDEGFESGVLPAGWSSVVNTGDCDIEFNMTTPFGPDFASMALLFNDDACGNDMPASNVTIFSDVYDLSSTDGGITIGYQVGFAEFNNSTFLAEYFDGDNWVELELYDETLNQILTESFDINATNTDFQVRWTYDDADDWGWYGGIDNFKIDNTLGLSDNNINGFSFAPNPAQDILNLSSKNQIIDRATVISILGQIVIDMPINADATTLDISSLTAGTYILKIKVGIETGTYHLIKQ